MTRSINIQRIRNFGIIAHVDAGKTTLTERLLHLTGAIHTSGEVHHGSTTTDSDELEKKKGITINSATVACHWEQHELHLIDTPGHVDFSADVELSLRVLDGAVVVLDGVAGVEPQTETVWHQAGRHHLPRLCFVNKLDREGASLHSSLEALVNQLGATPALLALPIEDMTGLDGLIDVVRQEARVWKDTAFDFELQEIPVKLRALAAKARNTLVEQCADFDDAVAEKFLMEEEVPDEDLVRALRKGTLQGVLNPVLCGSAYKNRGIALLLDAIVAYLPAPTDRPPVVGVEREERRAQDDEPFAGLTFKIINDKFGQLSLVRVFSGTLEKGAQISVEGSTHRVGRMVQVFANRKSEIASAKAGDIVGLIGIPLQVGDTLSAPEAPITLKRPVLPAPVMRICLEPVRREDRTRLGSALGKLAKADPSLKLETDRETGRAVLCGLGELHLEVAVEKLRTEHDTQVRVGTPSVAYREAIRQEVHHEFKFSKQTGGPGQFAHVVLVVGPGKPGSGLVFVDEIRGGAIAQEFIPGVRAGVEDAMNEGVLSGFPIPDLKVRLVDGSMHSNDSSDRAFRTAARRCTVEAIREAEPFLLEPIMDVEVTTPAQFVGKVVGDLGSRRGKISEMTERGTQRAIVAAVPLAELFGYVGTLRSLSSGRASFSAEFGKYQAVPDEVQKSVLKTP